MQTSLGMVLDEHTGGRGCWVRYGHCAVSVVIICQVAHWLAGGLQEKGTIAVPLTDG